MLCLLQNRSLGLALEREKQKAAGLSAELQKTKLIGTVPQAGTTDPQVHWFSCTFSFILIRPRGQQTELCSCKFSQ